MVPPARHRRWLLPLGCVLVAAFKLWLVHPDEVVATYNPYDQSLYVEMASHIAAGEWLGPYDVRTRVREPSYPAWLALVKRSGVPLRLASEALLLCAAALLTVTLRGRGLGGPACLAVFAIVALHPESLSVNRQALPAGFYLPMLLVALSGLWLAVRGRPARVLHALWAGFALGLLWTTRPEKPVLLAVVASWALLEIGAHWWQARAWRPAGLRVASVVVTATAAAVVIPACYAGLNARHYGVATTSDLSAPGFVAANRELHGLPHRSPRRYLLVPRDARRLAASVSPSFRALAPHIESSSWAAGVSCNVLDVCDDLGGSWFMFSMREAAEAEGHAHGAAELDAWFARIARELAAARERGDLPPLRRSLPLLHPYPGTFLGEVPGALVETLARLGSAGGPADWDTPRDHPSTDPELRALYDRVANRRPGQTSNGLVTLTGSIEWSDDPVDAVVLRPRGGARAARVPAFELRRDERGDLARFRIRASKPRPRFREGRPRLEITRASGAVVEFPMPALGATLEREGLRISLDTFDETSADDPVRAVARRALWMGHAATSPVLAGVGLLAVVALLATARRAPVDAPLLIAALVLLGASAARLALLALVSASAMPVHSGRYVYPAAAPAEVAAVVLVALAWRALRARQASR